MHLAQKIKTFNRGWPIAVLVLLQACSGGSSLLPSRSAPVMAQKDVGPLATYCATGGALNVTPPGPDVPEHFGKFSDTYDGMWDGKLSSLLVVQEIDADGTARGYYAWGHYPDWSFNEPGCQPFVGKISRNRLSFSMQTTGLTFAMIEGPSLDGTLSRGGAFTLGKFNKQ